MAEFDFVVVFRKLPRTFTVEDLTTVIQADNDGIDSRKVSWLANMYIKVMQDYGWCVFADGVETVPGRPDLIKVSSGSVSYKKAEWVVPPLRLSEYDLLLCPLSEFTTNDFKARLKAGHSKVYDRLFALVEIGWLKHLGKTNTRFPMNVFDLAPAGQEQLKTLAGEGITLDTVWREAEGRPMSEIPKNRFSRRRGGRR